MRPPVKSHQDSGRSSNSQKGFGCSTVVDPFSLPGLKLSPQKAATSTSLTLELSTGTKMQLLLLNPCLLAAFFFAAPSSHTPLVLLEPIMNGAPSFLCQYCHHALPRVDKSSVHPMQELPCLPSLPLPELPPTICRAWTCGRFWAGLLTSSGSTSTLR